MESSIDSSPADNVEAQLDADIERMRARVENLRSQLALQTSTIISSPHSSTLISRLRTMPNDSAPLAASLLEKSATQKNHNQSCLYRTCAGVTTFRVQDPDPYAVDSGKILGLRFEAFTGSKYTRPYYVFLNKPFTEKDILRVHRHTVPPCIPLASLAAKYLPTPKGDTDLEKVKRQDLGRFAKELRRQIVGYHNRVAVVKGLRKSCGLDTKSSKGKGSELVVADIIAVDAEVHQIRVEWVDGRIGRVVMSAKGDILKCAVMGEEGKDRATERQLLAGDRRIEGLAERMLR